NTSTGSLSGTASYQFQNTSGQKQNVAFGINPGYTISNVQVNGADVPFSVSEYQEYNEAMLEVTLPADEQAELVMEYSGFPQESRNMSTMQGSKEISTEYLCLENSALSPRLMNVMPGENGYPATIEITLPASMTAIPFGSSEAEVIAEHDNSTKTWRYEAMAGGIIYCDYVRISSRNDHRVLLAASIRLSWRPGAVDAVKAVVDYCTEHYGSLSFGTDETSSSSKPGHWGAMPNSAS
ncbi:MAG: hypothetical protein ACLRNW_29215, partial [Neglectibacter sp.]